MRSKDYIKSKPLVDDDVEDLGFVARGVGVFEGIPDKPANISNLLSLRPFRFTSCTVLT